MQRDDLLGSTSSAYHCIREARLFALGRTGPGGVIPPAKRCCDQLIFDPQGCQLFLRLLGHGTPAAKAYALYGLYVMDPLAYTTAVQPYRHDSTLVKQMSGCIAEEVPLSELVREIEVIGKLPLGCVLSLMSERSGGVAIYWRGSLVGRINEKCLIEVNPGWLYLEGGWEDLVHSEFRDALLRIRNFAREREWYGDESSATMEGPALRRFRQRLWARVADWLWRVWPASKVMRRRVLEFIRRQQDFVSLRQVRAGLGLPDIDPWRAHLHPVHRALAALADAGAIRVVEPRWLGGGSAFFATLALKATFPEHGYLPVVLRWNDGSGRASLACVTWPPDQSRLAFRRRTAT